jgi:hypothetical protein
MAKYPAQSCILHPTFPSLHETALSAHMPLLEEHPDLARLSNLEGSRSHTAATDGLLSRQEQHDGIARPQQITRIEAGNVGMHPTQPIPTHIIS